MMILVNVCCPLVISFFQSSIECNTPIGTGANRVLLVSSSGQSSSQFLFSYFLPTVTSTSLVTLPTSGICSQHCILSNFRGLFILISYFIFDSGGVLTIYGANLGAAVGGVSSLSINAVLCTITAANHVSLTVTVSASSGQAASGSVVATIDSQASSGSLQV